jgi:hypothetical protein
MNTTIAVSTIETQARQWAEFVRQFTSFDAEAKARQAVTCTLHLRAHALVLPTKLRRVMPFQEALSTLKQAGASYRRLYLKPSGRGAGAGLVAFYGAEPLGFLSNRHRAWVEGMTPEGRAHLHLYVSAVTGGTEAKPSRGCNILIAGVAEALDTIGQQA